MRFWQPRSANKYHAVKTSLDGYSFASKGESDLYCQLKLEEKAGLISDIQVQDHVYLTAARILYIADFKYFNIETQQHEWSEFKGLELPEWRIKRRLWLAGYGPGALRVFKKNGQRLILAETLTPKITEK